MVDSFPDYAQIICLGMPSIDRLTGPEQAPEWARLGNDGLAEIVAKYPDRFPGYAASLPMNAPEASDQIVSGIYTLEDHRSRWMSRRAVVALKRPAQAMPLSVNFYISPTARARKVSLLLDGPRIILYERVTMLARAAGEFPIMLWLLIKGADARPSQLEPL